MEIPSVCKSPNKYMKKISDASTMYEPTLTKKEKKTEEK